MSSYPFYDSFSNKAKDKDLTNKQKTDFIKKINKVDTAGLELIYAIIKVHEIKNSNTLLYNNIPYEGTYENKQLQFDLEKFPNKLKQILNKFITMHLKKMKEDKKK